MDDKIYKLAIYGSFVADDLERDERYNLFYKGLKVIFKKVDTSLLVTNFQYLDEGSVVYIPFMYQQLKINLAKWN